MSILYGQFETPFGPILVTAENDHVTVIAFNGAKHFPSISSDWIEESHNLLLASAHRQICEYLSGKRCLFTLPLAPAGTPFQLRIWETLQGIPYGKTVSYRNITHLLGKNECFTRAVAAAIAKNPVTLVVPCHRVIGSDGSLVGYAGGMERKKALLELEKTLPPCP